MTVAKLQSVGKLPCPRCESRRSNVTCVSAWTATSTRRLRTCLDCGCRYWTLEVVVGGMEDGDG